MTNNQLKVNKANLYRPNTGSEWDFSDIDEMQEDMLEQLLALTINIDPDSSESPHDRTRTPSYNYCHASTPSNLIHSISRSKEWDPEDLEIVETQMRKHLHHLQNN